MGTYLVKEKAIPITKDDFFKNYKNKTKSEKNHVLLESGRGGIQSIAAWDPLAVVASTTQGIHIKWRNGKEEYLNGESLTLIEELTLRYKLDTEEACFSGGVIGSIAYDYTREIEKLPTLAEDDLCLPNHYFFLVDHWVVYNELEKTMQFMKISTCTLDLERALSHFISNDTDLTDTPKGLLSSRVSEKLDVSMTESEFKKAVEKIQQYIAQGDVFQVNLSVRQSKNFEAEPILLYEALRTFNPSPYMAIIQSSDFAIVSGSPELLVKKKGNELSTRPIAGTRPRGDSDIEDQQLANELINHPKERAEHVMLVDLERNDLGKVSKYGSVFVDEFMLIEKYSHVMHIVSNIRGELAKDQTATSVIRAMFPGGTITGAPKIRTMEIIEELEPVRRGIYTGSIGWIGYNGDLEMNIVIRTAFIQDKKIHIQAGAGIVIDSIPANEYVESLNKAKAMWQAVNMVEGVLK